METLGEQFGRGFETNLLHLLLFDKQFAIQIASVVDPEQFEGVKHQEIVSVFIKLVQDNKGAAPSHSTVRAELHSRGVALDKDGRNKGRAKTCRNAVRFIDTLKEKDPPSSEDQKFIEEKLAAFITYRAMQAAFFTSITHHEQENTKKPSKYWRKRPRRVSFGLNRIWALNIVIPKQSLKATEIEKTRTCMPL